MLLKIVCHATPIYRYTALHERNKNISVVMTSREGRTRPFKYENSDSVYNSKVKHEVVGTC